MNIRHLFCVLVTLLTLTACGGGGGSGGGTTPTPTPTPTNTTPVANAGSNQNVETGVTVQLSGEQSSDADGDNLSYSWQMTTRPPGSIAELSSTDTATTSFVADIDGDYIVSLTVNDGQADSSAVQVTITATTPNRPPTAGAGEDQTIELGQSATLTASASSDPDQDALSYQWQLTSKPQGSQTAIENNTLETFSITPDSVGDYVFSLTVNDGELNSEPDSVILTVVAPNTVPVANAGSDAIAAVGNTVTLDGSASSDADGDSLSFNWQIASKPENSTSTLNNAQNVKPTLLLDVPGTFVLSLTVSDGEDISEADTVSVVSFIPNSAPTANAGNDTQVNVGDTVTLSGAQSSDPDGNTLSYTWQMTISPEGSSASLTGSNTVSPSFIADVAGNYQISLIVNDGSLNSESDSVTVTAVEPNRAPVANAGEDSSATAGATITLSGILSSDPDDDSLSYSWTLSSKPSGSAATLSNANSVSPSFVADIEGSYVASLTVSDGELSSEADNVTITVTEATSAPIANAGADQQAVTGQTIVLSGSDSTAAEGKTLTYNWQFTSIPGDSSAVLNNASSVSPSFLADVVGDYTISLVVNDGEQSSDPDSVTIRISAANNAPVANAGEDVSVTVGNQVTLSGAQSSDPDNDALTYSWHLAGKPENSAVTLSAADTVSPSLTPDEAGNYVINLTVNDGTVDSESDQVIVTANPVNATPVANAGNDQTVTVGQLVTLSGAASSDADDDTITFNWQITTKPDGSSATLSDSTSISPTFTADLAGSYVVSLTVNDGQADSTPDSVTITSQAPNTAPTANAGPDQVVTVGQIVTLDGSASSDAEGDSLSYTWQFASKPDGSAASMRDNTAVNPSFIADVSGSYSFSLTVSDGQLTSNADTVSITASTGTFTGSTATTTVSNLFSSGSRTAALGTVDDGQLRSRALATWTVPADVNYSNSIFPFASDLHNIYVSGHDYNSASDALEALDGSDIIELDSSGEVITAYVFADNYFEMYVNGTAVGKDPVPYTDFNSNIIRFRVAQPFTVAMLLVDWEENLGSGTESLGGNDFHPGDGGMVAVFKDENGNTIGVTDNSWKAQTYYIAPIADKTCITESNNQRLSTGCSTEAPSSLDNISGVHWALPSNWSNADFDDSGWPQATTYTNETVGVDNKASYTNFTDVFDDSSSDAQFIWSTNLVLDNEVLVRGTIGTSSFNITSKSLKTDNILPLDATCDGVNSGNMIELAWSKAPSTTNSYAITMHHYANAEDEGDLSKATGHYVLYDIPGSTTSLSRGQSDIGSFGINSVGSEQGFSAPCASDTSNQTYTITIYALSGEPGSLNLEGSTTDLVALTNAISETTVATATLSLTRTRYNPSNDDHVPTSVATTCEAKADAFSTYSSYISTSCDSTKMTVTTNTMLPYRSGLDGDKPNVGIKSWIGRVPIPEKTAWTLPLQPTYLSEPTSNINIHHAIGVSVEGVAILHYAKETTPNETAILGTDYSDRDTILLGEVDQCGAHAGNGEDYHYHTAPLCLMDTHDPSKPLAYMFDGIPLYFGTGGGVLTNDGTDYGAGRYAHLDYRPAKVKSGERPLDDCNAYDVNGDGSEYVYYSSIAAPYTIACFRGQADQESSVPGGPHWTEERDLSWAGSDVELTDHDTLTFEGATWTFIEITPGSSNNNIPSGQKAVILYRQLTSADSGYEADKNCYRFRYRLDSTDTDGSDDTVATHCR